MDMLQYLSLLLYMVASNCCYSTYIYFGCVLLLFLREAGPIRGEIETSVSCTRYWHENNINGVNGCLVDSC